MKKVEGGHPPLDKPRGECKIYILLCLAVIIKRSVKMRKNPYSNTVFAGTKDFEEAMARAEL